MSELDLNDRTVAVLTTESSQEEVYDAAFSVGGSFGVRVSRTGRKAFFVVFPLHGKRKRMTIGNFPLLSVAEARERANAIVKKAKHGEDAAAEWRIYRSSESFRDATRLFREEYIKRECSAKTAQEYSRILDRELLPLWGDRKIRDIRSEEISRLLHHISKRRDAPVLAARVRAVASSLFSFAKEGGLISINPARQTKTPEAHNPRDRVLTVEELRQLFRALEEETTEIQALFKVLILTGQRIQKVLAMSWADIRVDLWHVPSASKSGKSCPIHLVPQVMQTLKEMRHDKRGSAFIFHSPKGGSRRSLSRAIRRLNIRMRSNERWNALDLCRTFQASLSRLGIRPDLIDLLQQRRATLNQRSFSESPYNYDREVREALTTWARAVLPSGPSKGSDKVVSLFK